MQLFLLPSTLRLAKVEKERRGDVWLLWVDLLRDRTPTGTLGLSPTGLDPQMPAVNEMWGPDST